MVATARKLGIAPKAKRKEKDVVTRCPEHLAGDAELLGALGFLSLSDLILYADALSRRGRKPLNAVRFPKEKCPPGILRVVAVRCKRCRAGYSCRWCNGWGYGFRFYLARGEHKCAPTEAVASTLVASTSNSSPAPQVA